MAEGSYKMVSNVGNIEIKGAVKKFINAQNEEITALNGIDLTIEAGSFISLVLLENPAAEKVHFYDL